MIYIERFAVVIVGEWRSLKCGRDQAHYVADAVNWLINTDTTTSTHLITTHDIPELDRSDTSLIFSTAELHTIRPTFSLNTSVATRRPDDLLRWNHGHRGNGDGEYGG